MHLVYCVYEPLKYLAVKYNGLCPISKLTTHLRKIYSIEVVSIEKFGLDKETTNEVNIVKRQKEHK